LLALRAEIKELRLGPPTLASIAEEAQNLINKGELDAARGALSRGRDAARAVRIDSSRYEAGFLAQEARLDDLQLAYRPAAAKYSESASLVAPFDKFQQWRFLGGQARELYTQGKEFGDNAALVEAIDIYRRCLDLAPLSERPLDWAATENDLGNALLALGERGNGTALLQEAIAAYHNALGPPESAKAEPCSLKRL
jgi:tetratricopeptide (TPR) repeat protein